MQDLIFFKNYLAFVVVVFYVGSGVILNVTSLLEIN